MKHLKKFNEEIGDPRITGMSDPDENGVRYPIRKDNVEDDIYKTSDDYEILKSFVEELGLDVTEEQIINFLKNLSN